MRWSPKDSLGRVVDSLAPAVQITIGALLAYSVAFYALGHVNPLLAVTVCITSLGFSRDASIKFGPPNFDDAKIEIQNAKTFTINLRD